MWQKSMNLARGLACWSRLAGASERHRGVARVLVYHGTLAGQAAELERQFRYLARDFQIVPFGEIVARLPQGAPALGRRVAITFDDGLRNNLTVAYPILRRLGIPATFFVCPDNLERNQWLWTHEARWRLSHCAPRERCSLAEHHGQPDMIEPILNWMKRLPLASRREFESSLRAATPGLRPSPAERHVYDLANWDELRALDERLITIGSHTVTHPILPGLTAEDCEFELRESQRQIEARLQRPAAFFAYPNGDYSAQVRAMAGRYYRAAVTDVAGWAHADSDPLLIPRLNVSRGVLRLANVMHRRHLAPIATAPARLRPQAV